MLEGGAKHLYLIAGDEWVKGSTDAENVKTIDQIDVLEDASITVTCDWYETTDGGTTWSTLNAKTIDLPAGRYDMSIDSITVVSGFVHLVKA